jgi:malate dehydrogenase (oxaloacetate-decarboxylating)
MVAARNAGVELSASVIGQIGLGAAGYGIASLMVQGGGRRVMGYDPVPGARERAAAAGVELASMEEVMASADIVLATTGRPGLIEPSMVRRGQVVLALSNPDPEILPEAAEAAGAAFAADGRSVNNVLGYPGIFRGALESGASEINVEMKLAAAKAIAELTQEGEIVPDALSQDVHEAVARAVREAAKSSGVARRELATAEL